MLSGWFNRFPINRIITPQERGEPLSRDLKRFASVETRERGSVVHLNSTYLDMIDRWFRLRGGINSIFTLIMLMLMLGIFLFYFFFVFIAYYLRGKLGLAIEIGLCIMFALGVVFPIVMGRRTLGREFYSYTYFPIRFNRQTQMVHVFRHNGPGGVLSVPWEQVYFHIGHGRIDKAFLDVRGHVMDGDTVKDTFAVGHFFDSKEPVQQIWKFIATYMDQGPQALPDDIAILTATGKDYKNCLIWSITYCNIFMYVPPFTWVFVGLVAAMRWTVMRTCKAPVWPAAIEAESVIAADDPHRWREPSVTGELANDEKVWAALQASKRRRESL
jgi:hypothetical protein